MSSFTVHACTVVKLLAKLRTASLIRPVENAPYLLHGAIFDSETVLGFDEGFKIASFVAHQTQYLYHSAAR